MSVEVLTTVFSDNRAVSRKLRKSKLIVNDGPDKGKELLIAKEKITVGRGKINDLVLTDKAISGCHYEIISTEKGYLLRDLDSTNGTFYGDCRVKEIYLTHGVVFTAGQTKFKFTPLKDSVDIPLSAKNRFDMVIGGSIKMREIFATLEKIAPTDLTILLSGETGTGKDIIARSIHKMSRRAQGNIVIQDCSAIPKDLTESILFGHEKGSFTGATSQHVGSFEQANNGSIFLDEIGELPLDLQPKLLRVLENRQIRKVGGLKEIDIDVRIIAATNRDLRELINKGQFREDLYYRLSVIHIEIPPLRDRKEDIPALVQLFLNQISDNWFNKEQRTFRVTPEAMDKLMSYAWPGNVRELKNVVERAVYLASGDVLTPDDFKLQLGCNTPVNFNYNINQDILALSFKDAKQAVLDQFEITYLKELIKRNNSNITHSSKQAGLTRYHLRELLKHHGLISYDKPDPEE